MPRPSDKTKPMNGVWGNLRRYFILNHPSMVAIYILPLHSIPGVIAIFLCICTVGMPAEFLVFWLSSKDVNILTITRYKNYFFKKLHHI